MEIERKLCNVKKKSTPTKKIVCSKKKKSSLEKISPQKSVKSVKSPKLQEKSPNFRLKVRILEEKVLICNIMELLKKYHQVSILILH